MGCAITESRDRVCKSFNGGLRRVYIFPFVKYNRSQIVRDGLTITTFPTTTIYKFEMLGGSALTQTQDNDDGLKSYKQTIDIKFSQNDNDFKLQRLLKKDARLIIEDNNGNFRLLGAYNGAECTKLDYATGGGYSDLNGITLSFEASEREEALFIDDLAGAGFEIARYLLLQDGTFLLLQTGEFLELEI